MFIEVKVITKSSQDKIIPYAKKSGLKIKVTEAPEKGKANQKVMKLLAREFDVPVSRIEIVKGLTNSNKLVKIDLD